MKQSDTKILYHIRKNARMNLTTISRRTGIPVSTIFDRLRSHEGRLITKFTALLNFQELGYPVRMKLFLKSRPDMRNELKNYLLAHPNVNTLQRINNGYDYAADCAFRTIKDAEDFSDNLEQRFVIVQRQAFHVVDDIAREKMLTTEVTLDD